MSQQSLYLASVFCLSSFVCLPTKKKKNIKIKDIEVSIQHSLPLTHGGGGDHLLKFEPSI